MPQDIPWEIQLTLRAGTVFYMPHRGLTSAEPHYLIVVNAHPLQDELLLLAVASSKVESVRARRRNLPSETLVEISPAEYDEFSKPSVVDCNGLFKKSLVELVEEQRRGGIHPKKDLPAQLLAKIQAGVKASPLVEEEAKKLIE